MNKKIIVLILIIFCLASTIIISVFGKVPDDSGRVPVNAIMFVDNSTEDGLCVENADGHKTINIERGTETYQLEWLINPSQASEQEVTFQIVSGQDYATVSETGLVTFTMEYPVTIKIYSNMTDFKSDVVIISFVGNQNIVIPDEEDPFD